MFDFWFNKNESIREDDLKDIAKTMIEFNSSNSEGITISTDFKLHSMNPKFFEKLGKYNNSS